MVPRRPYCPGRLRSNRRAVLTRHYRANDGNWELWRRLRLDGYDPHWGVPRWDPWTLAAASRRGRKMWEWLQPSDAFLGIDANPQIVDWYADDFIGPRAKP